MEDFIGDPDAITDVLMSIEHQVSRWDTFHLRCFVQLPMMRSDGTRIVWESAAHVSEYVPEGHLEGNNDGDG